jgi:hypothetical protein
VWFCKVPCLLIIVKLTDLQCFQRMDGLHAHNVLKLCNQIQNFQWLLRKPLHNNNVPNIKIRKVQLNLNSNFCSTGAYSHQNTVSVPNFILVLQRTSGLGVRPQRYSLMIWDTWSNSQYSLSDKYSNKWLDKSQWKRRLKWSLLTALFQYSSDRWTTSNGTSIYKTRHQILSLCWQI